MRIEGEHVLASPREAVWAALNDPDVLVKAAPGVKALEPTGPDAYAATIELAIGPVRGAYQGTARITDKTPPHKMTIIIEGGGRPGTITATGALTLDSRDGTTVVRYVGDVRVTGVLMSVGHRLFGGIARELAGKFFTALEREVAARSRPAGTAGS